MKTRTTMEHLIEAATGERPCDLLIRNVRLVDVFRQEIVPAEIAILDGRIVSTDPEAGLDAKERTDAGEMYALPGLIDTHVHYETTLLAPERLADVLVPQGTTTLYADPMEIANVSGLEGVEELTRTIRDLPFRTFIQISSRVPTAPGLETNGATLGLEETKIMLDWPETLSLGELDPTKILIHRGEYLDKMEATYRHGKQVNGHAIGRTGRDLDAYAATGICDDHECVTIDDLLDRLRRGMSVLLREGSSERNTRTLIEGVLERDINTEHLMFCSDDKHPQDILRDGHINENVNIATELGMDPVEAITLATLNAARHAHLEDEIGSLTPGRKADIILTDSLSPLVPNAVYFEGKRVAEDGELIVQPPEPDYPEWIRSTVTVPDEFGTGDLKVPSHREQETTARVIDLISGQIINRASTETLPVQKGEILADPSRDILKMAAVERHGRNGNVGVGFVHGFGLERGAIASSVAHDHHNIVVVGVDENDMVTAVRRLEELQGGFVAVDGGDILAELALPIGGLMSLRPAGEVIQAMDELNRTAKQLGSAIQAPFMLLSFISLPTVPDLGLTDKGLVDVLNYELIPVEVDS